MSATSRARRTVVGLTLVAAVTIAGCGSDGDSESSPPSSTTTTFTTAPADTAATTAAGTGSPPASTFPVTIEHALGTTVIPSKPERVITLGYGEGDVPAALGIVPVAINGSGTVGGQPSPWLATALQGKPVELLDLAGGIPYERIAGLQPDVILALTSNIDDTAYRLLSDIAPTVAYQQGPYQDSWRDATITAGRALGMEGEAKALVEQVDQQIDSEAAASPDLQGKTVSVVLAISPDQVGVLTSPEENTVRTLTQLGMQMPEAVKALGVGPSGYSAVISLEQVPTLDADVMLMYAINDEARSALLDSPLFPGLPVVQRGDVLPIERSVWTALRAPSVLSIPYAFGQLTGPIKEAAAN